MNQRDNVVIVQKTWMNRECSHSYHQHFLIINSNMDHCPWCLLSDIHIRIIHSYVPTTLYIHTIAILTQTYQWDWGLTIVRDLGLTIVRYRVDNLSLLAMSFWMALRALKTNQCLCQYNPNLLSLRNILQCPLQATT